MSVSIKDCKVDDEFRALIPCASWDERAELQASVERFGYLSPIVAWKNELGECLILDGHNRFESWKAACSNPGKSGLAASEPEVVVLDLPSREDAMLFVISGQLARRNVSSIDRIELVAKRETLIKQLAKANQAQAGQKSMFGRMFGAKPKLLMNSSKPDEPINTRKQCAAEANVSEMTYDDGKAVLAAVADGTLPQQVVEDIRNGSASIHGVAESLKRKTGKPARKAKSSGWQTLIRTFSSAIRRIMKRSLEQRAAIAETLRNLAAEIESDAQAAA